VKRDRLSPEARKMIDDDFFGLDDEQAERRSP
jgi:hypothetical protein